MDAIPYLVGAITVLAIAGIGVAVAGVKAARDDAPPPPPPPPPPPAA